jgi:hypothetical protein
MWPSSAICSVPHVYRGVRGRRELSPHRMGFSHDPAAYRDWRAGRPFNVCRWDRDMRWMLYRGVTPDFVVVTDVVAGGLASLAWSAFWRDSVPRSSRPTWRCRTG